MKNNQSNQFTKFLLYTTAEQKSNVQNLHIANSDKPVKYFNLDVIISAGYRVKSLQGPTVSGYLSAQ